MHEYNNIRTSETLADASDVYRTLHKNLMDAGCSEKGITVCMDYAQKGEWKKLLPILTHYKKILLE